MSCRDVRTFSNANRVRLSSFTINTSMRFPPRRPVTGQTFPIESDAMTWHFVAANQRWQSNSGPPFATSWAGVNELASLVTHPGYTFVAAGRLRERDVYDGAYLLKTI